MKFHGIQITEGANVANLTVASGTAFPSNANEGELFYRSDVSTTVKGLYLYVGGNWDRIASADSITAPSGASFPAAANTGDLFYRDSNDSGEGLYVYNGATWIPAASGSGSTATVTGDVAGTLTIGGSAPLTLATVNSNVGSFGSASNTITLTVNAKGLVTAASAAPISIAGSQITSGTVPSAQISETSVTQHQSALALSATQLTSGVLPDARVSQSNVTQHQTALTIAETQITDGAIFPRINGSETITGSYQFNNPVVVPAPSSGSHATSKDYVDQAIAGLSWKNSARVATTANITLSGTQTIDGVVLAVGNRVLVKDQSTSSQNGVYVVAAGAWSRATDFDSISPIDEINSAAVFVQLGTVNADTAWTQIASVALVGTDAIVFTQFAGTNTYLAGAGMTLSTNIFNVGTANSGRIVVNTDNIDLATVGTPVTAAFVKPTTDAYGRVTATTPVTTADVTSLVASEYLRLDGTTPMTGQLRISDGSVTAPGIRFADDLTTGIYAPNDFVVAITTQGVERARFGITSALFSTPLGIGEAVGTNEMLRVSSATANVPVYARVRATGADTGAQVVGLQLNSSAGLGGIELNGAANTANAGAEGLNIFAATNGAIAFQTLSGRTERMRISSAGFVGIGSTNPLRPLHVTGAGVEDGVGGITQLTVRSTVAFNATPTAGIQFGANLNAAASQFGMGGISMFKANTTDGDTATTMTFFTRTAGFPGVTTERMRIDSAGNVGVGTTTPAYRLHIATSQTSALGVFRDLDVTSVGPAGTFIELGARSGSTFVAGSQIQGVLNNPATTGSLVFSTLSTTMQERMRITSAGDVGIGTTGPAGYGKLAVVGGNIATSFDGSTVLTLRANTGVTTLGAFNTTTGAIMTFNTNVAAAGEVERMRIDSNGNVGINTQNPASFGRFSVVNTTARYFSISTNGVTALRYDDNSQPYLFLQNLGMTAINHGYGLNWQLGHDGSTNINAGRLLVAAESVWGAAASTQNSYMSFATTSLGTLNTRAIITSTGNVGIGTIVPADKLHVRGSNSANQFLLNLTTDFVNAGTVSMGIGGFADASGSASAGASLRAHHNHQVTSAVDLSFWTSPSGSTGQVERMRINNTGDVLFGTTSVTPGNDTTAWVGITASGSLANPILVHVPNNAITGWIFQSFYRGNVSMGNIQYNGTGTSYVTTSDARRKENIVDAPSAGAKIDSIQVRSFDWKDSDARTEYGFVAQELVTVAPEAVTIGGDDANSEPWGVDPSKLIGMLIKEIQELRARVAALENT